MCVSNVYDNPVPHIPLLSLHYIRLIFGYDIGGAGATFVMDGFIEHFGWDTASQSQIDTETGLINGKISYILISYTLSHVMKLYAPSLYSYHMLFLILVSFNRSIWNRSCNWSIMCSPPVQQPWTKAYHVLGCYCIYHWSSSSSSSRFNAHALYTSSSIRVRYWHAINV